MRSEPLLATKSTSSCLRRSLPLLAEALLDHADVHGVPARPELVVDHVLHNVALLDLSKAKPRIPEPHVLEVVLQGAADIAPSLHVVAPRLLNDEGVLEVADIAGDRVRGDLGVGHASERVRELARIRERPDAGGEHVHEVIKLAPPPDALPVDDIPQMRLLEEPLEIARFLLVRVHREREWYAAVHRVLRPSSLAVAIELLHELEKDSGRTQTSSPRPRNSVMTSHERSFELLPVTHTSTLRMRRSPLSTP